MTREEILRRLASHLDQEEFDRLLRRIDGDPDTEDVAWLEQLADAAATLPLAEVPPVLARALRRQVRGPIDVVEHTAILRADSRTSDDLVGVRGEGDEDGWTWSFVCDVADVLVDVWPRADRRFDVDVHVILTGGEPAAFQADLSGAGSHTSSSDDLGRTTFEAIVPGAYTLRLNSGDDVILAAVDLGVQA